MWAIGLLVGGLLGAGLDREGSIIWGALIGLALGLLAGHWWKRLLERVRKLEARVDLLSRAVSADARDFAPSPGASPAVGPVDARLPILDSVPAAGDASGA